MPVRIFLLFNCQTTEHLFTVVQILIALSIALAVFLSEYLLYRYDHDKYGND